MSAVWEALDLKPTAIELLPTAWAASAAVIEPPTATELTPAALADVPPAKEAVPVAFEAAPTATAFVPVALPPPNSAPAWAALEAIKAPATATTAATALRLSEADFLPCAWLISETAVHVWVEWFQITLKTLFISIFL